MADGDDILIFDDDDDIDDIYDDDVDDDDDGNTNCFTYNSDHGNCDPCCTVDADVSFREASVWRRDDENFLCQEDPSSSVSDSAWDQDVTCPEVFKIENYETINRGPIFDQPPQLPSTSKSRFSGIPPFLIPAIKKKEKEEQQSMDWKGYEGEIVLFPCDLENRKEKREEEFPPSQRPCKYIPYYDVIAGKRRKCDTACTCQTRPRVCLQPRRRPLPRPSTPDPTFDEMQGNSQRCSFDLRERQRWISRPSLCHLSIPRTMPTSSDRNIFTTQTQFDVNPEREEEAWARRRMVETIEKELNVRFGDSHNVGYDETLPLFQPVTTTNPQIQFLSEQLGRGPLCDATLRSLGLAPSVSSPIVPPLLSTPTWPPLANWSPPPFNPFHSSQPLYTSSSTPQPPLPFADFMQPQNNQMFFLDLQNNFGEQTDPNAQGWRGSFPMDTYQTSYPSSGCQQQQQQQPTGYLFQQPGIEERSCMCPARPSPLDTQPQTTCLSLYQQPCAMQQYQQIDYQVVNQSQPQTSPVLVIQTQPPPPQPPPQPQPQVIVIQSPSQNPPQPQQLPTILIQYQSEPPPPPPQQTFVIQASTQPQSQLMPQPPEQLLTSCYDPAPCLCQTNTQQQSFAPYSPYLPRYGWFPGEGVSGGYSAPEGQWVWVNRGPPYTFQLLCNVGPCQVDDLRVLLFRNSIIAVEANVRHTWGTEAVTTSLSKRRLLPWGVDPFSLTCYLGDGRLLIVSLPLPYDFNWPFSSIPLALGPPLLVPWEGAAI